MAKEQPEPTAREQSFETAIERLESIVEAMESDKMPLEELLVRYEEGIQLVKTCQQKLEAAERRIEVITRGARGKPQLREFEPGAATAPTIEASDKSGDRSPDVSLF